MIKFIKVFCDISETVDELSDAEAGRLFKAILHYGLTETVDHLPGQEKLVFRMLKSQIDRDRESYDKKSQQNRENGSKGGRPKKPTWFSNNPEKPTWFSNNPEKPTGFSNNPEKPRKSQDKDKDKDIIPLTPLPGDDDDDLFRIQQEHNQVLDAACKAGFPDTDSVFYRLIDLYGRYGLDKLIAAIDCCVEHSAVNLAYLRAVLQDKPKPEEDSGDWMDALRRRGIGG